MISLSNGPTTLELDPNLLWEDELAWDPVTQSAEYSLTGALIIEESETQAGRPVTLAGGEMWVELTRVDLLILRALIAPSGVTLTLTLHDGRTLDVTPRRDGDGALRVRPAPVVGSSGAADPSATALYIIDALRFLVVA